MSNEAVVVDPAQNQNVDANGQATLGNPAGDGTAPAQNADGTNPAPAQPAADPNAAQPKPENHDARRLKKFMDKASQLEAENLALKAQIGGGQKQAQAGEPQAPVRENFANEDDFIQARIDYGISKAIPTIREQISSQTMRTTAENAFQQREIELRKEKPDYDDIISEAGNVRIPPIVADAILTSELGPDLRYYLAQNPDKAQKLNYMPPAAAARELGKIEAEIIGSKGARPAVRPSNAPAPIRPVSGNGVVVETDLEKLPQEEYNKRRNEERKKLGKPY